jgi:hypothetical protein
MAVEAFLINIGLTFIGNLLFPKRKEQQSPEDIPSLGQGSDIYVGFGLFSVPANLLYATPASIAGHGTDKSTFGVLGIANPAIDCEILAIRVNNIVAASKTPLFSITESIIGVYDNLGITSKNGFSFTFQNFVTTNNPQFGLNGYGGFKYEGLTWVAFNGCERQKYGGFNSRISLIYKNKAISSTNVPFTIKGSDSITVNLGITYGNSKNIWAHWYSKTFKNGFHGIYFIYGYEIGSNKRSRGVVAVGGGEEYLLSIGNPDIDTAPYPGQPPAFVTSAISPDTLPSLPGTSIIATDSSTYVQPTSVNSIVIAVEGGQLESITLTNSEPLPFYSNSNIVYNALQQPIYFDNSGRNIYLVGWDNKYFFYNYYDSENQSLVPAGSTPTVGITQSSLTTLATIIEELLRLKGAFRAGQNFINQSTLVDIRGYATTLTDITDKIINLCTAYNKFCFQDGEGDFWLVDYPNAISVETFDYEDFLDEPTFIESPEINQPDQIEYSYRSLNNELSERVIHIGNSSINNNSTDSRSELVQKEIEAKKSAWNILFLRSHTNMSLTFRSMKGIARAGKTIRVLGDLYLVANIEIGEDMSFSYNCVNYVPLNNTLFTDYMIADSQKTNVIQITNIQPFFITTEPTSVIENKISGGRFFTNDNNNTSFHQNNGDITPLRTIIPATGGFLGVLFSYNSSSITILRGGGINLPPLASGLIRIGLSWVSYTSYTQNGDSFTLLGIEIGKYSSSNIIRNGDYVAQINDNNYSVGYENTTNIPILPEVNQNNIDYIIKSYPPSLTNNPIPNFGDVTTNFPYGYPCSGILTAKVISSTFAGITHIWITKPGGENENFIYEPATNYQEPFNKKFLIKQGISTYIDLGVINNGYTTHSVNLLAGSYTIYQAKQLPVGLNLNLYSKGSFNWNCTNI